MNLKNLLAGTIAGSIVYFLLGWLFYGKLFPDIYPATPEQNLVYIYLGCFFYALMLSYIFDHWANIRVWKTGFIAGAILGGMGALSMNFFMYSNMPMNWNNLIMDVIITIVSAGLTGAVIAFVLQKVS